MEDLFKILAIAAAALLLFFVTYAALRYATLGLSWVMNAVADIHAGVRETADATGWRMREKARKRQALRWLNAKVGAARPTGSVDPDVLQARAQTPVIRRLVHEEVPATIRRCLQIHRVMALASGAEFIYEIGDEPECQLMRERVADLVELSVEILETYPLLLDDSRLLQNVVVLRKRILPTCRECPYLQHAVDSAPSLCPSAEIAQIPPEGCKSNECGN